MASNDAVQALLTGLMSSDTSIRTQFEAQYQEMKRTSPDFLVERFSEFLFQTRDAATFQLLTVLIRRCFEDETTEGAWAKLVPGERKDHVRQQLLQCFSQASLEIKNARKSLSHVLAQLAKLETKEWPQLFRVLFETAQHENPDIREGAFELFAQVSEYAPHLVIPHSFVIGQVMAKGLMDEQSVNVRLTSLRAMGSLVVSMQDDSGMQVFKETIPIMLQALKAALDLAVSSQNAELESKCSQSGLKTFNDLCVHHPKFLRSCPEFPQLVESMMSIATAKTLESETRSMALEFLVSCAEHMAKFLKKHLPTLVQNFVPLAMELMCEQQEDDDDEDSLSSSAEDAVHRMSMGLGGKLVMPAIWEVLPTMLTSPDYRIRRAGVKTLSLCAEGCGKRMYLKLDQVVALCVQCAQDPSFQVRYSTVHLLGQLCVDFGDDSKSQGSLPTFQKLYAAKVLPLLSEFLLDENDKVRTHTAGALVNYFVDYGDLTPEDVSFALDQLLERLLQHVVQGNFAQKEEALVAIAGIATVAGPTLFSRYYQHLMPVIVQVASMPYRAEEGKQENAEQYYSMVGRALECAGLMAVAVGRKQFPAQDAQTLLQLILPNCLASSLESGGNQTLRMFCLAAVVRLCEAMKEDFLPFLPQLVPELIRGCKEDIAVEEIDIDRTQEMEQQGFQVVHFNQRGEATKSVKINSSAVQEISTCSFALYSLVSALGELFAPYSSQTFETLVPLLQYDGLLSIRNCTILALPHLVRSCSSQRQMASEMLVLAMVTLMEKLNDFENAMEELQAEDELEGELEAEMESSLHCGESMVSLLKQCYESGGARDNDPFMGKRIFNFPPRYGLFTKFPEVVFLVTQALLGRVELIIQHRVEFDSAEHDEEKFERRDAQHMELAERLVDCIGYLLKLNAPTQEYSASIVEHVFPLFPVLFGETSLDEKLDFKRLGVCLLDDYLEFYPHGTDVEFRQMGFQVLLQGAQSPNHPLARASVWGLGICAMYADSSLFTDKLVDESIQVLGQAIERRRAVEGNNNEDEEEVFFRGLVVDNALSALEKIVSFRRREDVELLNRILHCLPLSADAEEARVLNAKLSKYMDIQRYGALLVAQLHHGHDGVRGWVEEDAFLHPQTRMELYKGLASGQIKLDTQNLSQDLQSLLSDLGTWAARTDLNVA